MSHVSDKVLLAAAFQVAWLQGVLSVKVNYETFFETLLSTRIDKWLNPYVDIRVNLKNKNFAIIF